MIKKTIFIAAFTLFLSISFAHAQSTTSCNCTTTYFSFASDDIHDGPTFRNDGPNKIVNNTANDVVDLKIDLNNDADRGVTTMQAIHTLSIELSNHQAIPYAGGFLHMWEAKGIVKFNQANFCDSHPAIMTITFDQAVLTSYSVSVTRLGETVTLQNSATADLSMNMNAFGPLGCFGVTFLQPSSDFAYTFTNVRPNGVCHDLVVLDGKGNFMDDWSSEGSFSASGGTN